MVEKLKLSFNLLLTMMKIGLFTFGGGYAMLALLENEFVTEKKWLEKEEFIDMTAIAESTPGPIAINCATYIGYKNAGFLGSLFSTIGVCIPSFVIIYLISRFIEAFLSYRVVESAFRGIQVCVVYLIFSTGIKMFKSLKKNVFSLIAFCVTFFSMICFSLFSINFSSVFYILIFGVGGIFFYSVFNLGEGNK